MTRHLQNWIQTILISKSDFWGKPSIILTTLFLSYLAIAHLILHFIIQLNIFRVTNDLEKCIIHQTNENHLSFTQVPSILTYDLYLQSYGTPKRSHFFLSSPYIIGLNFGPDLPDAVMICKSEMAKLSRIECSFISALVKIVSLPGTVSSDSNKLHLLSTEISWPCLC